MWRAIKSAIYPNDEAIVTFLSPGLLFDGVQFGEN